MYISIDIGGTNARIAFSKKLDKTSFYLKSFKLSHNFEKDYNKIISTIDREIRKIQIQAISIGIAGNLNKNKLVESNNLPEWVDKDFVKEISKKYDCPTLLNNDVVVSAFSEKYNKKLKTGTYLYISWGTGIGGALITKRNNNFSVKQIDWSKYLKEFELNCGGKNIQNTHNKLARKFGYEIWSKILDDFEQHIIILSKKFKTKDIILTGGITEKQKNNVNKLTEKLKDKNVNLKISSFGKVSNLYGGFALIKK